MKLLLFDIDLTLIDSARSGRRAMTLAFEKLFGIKDGMDKVNFAGRTDRAIFRDALAYQGLEWQKEKEENFKGVYFEKLKIEIAKPNSEKHLEPGVLELLNELNQREDVFLGLLTGNWRQGAQIKLEHFNLYHFFELGAFADDSENRNELPRSAVQRFSEKMGLSISPENVFIVGDTPLDIACAKSFDAKSVAVATGFFSYEDLEAAQPDFLFTDFSVSEKFLRILVEGK